MANEASGKVYALSGQLIDTRVAVDAVVKKIEEMLEMAKAGELIALCACGELHDRATITFKAGTPGVPMIGVVSKVLSGLIDHCK